MQDFSSAMSDARHVFQAAVSQRSCVNILQLDILCVQHLCLTAWRLVKRCFKSRDTGLRGTGTRHGVVRWIGGSVDRDSSFGLSCFVVVALLLLSGSGSPTGDDDGDNDDDGKGGDRQGSAYQDHSWDVLFCRLLLLLTFSLLLSWGGCRARRQTATPRQQQQQLQQQQQQRQQLFTTTT